MSEYNGTIELISGITPKNGGTFPLVNDKDVLLSNGARLSDLKINGVKPDENGNIQVQGGGSATDIESELVNIHSDIAGLANEALAARESIQYLGFELGKVNGKIGNYTKMVTDPYSVVTPEILDNFYTPKYYSGFSAAVADLNTGTIGANSITGSENAVCALYKDYDGTNCLVLLKDIDLSEKVTFSVDVNLKINGHTVNYLGDYYLDFKATANKCTIDLRVDGSRLFKDVESASVLCGLINTSCVNTEILGGTIYNKTKKAIKSFCCVYIRSNAFAKIKGCSMYAEASSTEGDYIAIGVMNLGGADIEDTKIVAKSGEYAAGINHTSAATSVKVAKCHIDVYSINHSAQGCVVPFQDKDGNPIRPEIKVDISDTTIKVYSEQSSCCGIISTYDTTIVNCDISAEAIDWPANAIRGYAGEYVIVNCNLSAEASNSVAIAIEFSAGNCMIDSCQVYAASKTIRSAGLEIAVGVQCKAINSSFHGDGVTSSVFNTGVAYGDGIRNFGELEAENCMVYGVHSGLVCSAGSTTIVNGGIYEGPGHGGLYLANAGGNFYAQNATFRTANYRGQFKKTYTYSGMYKYAAVYIGGNESASYIKAFMDNCVLDGGGPLYKTDGTGETATLVGAEPIRFRASAGETHNYLYASNCTFMGEGKIQFLNITHRLYLGLANRIMCDVSENGSTCLDTTTYANKVFTNYGED